MKTVKCHSDGYIALCVVAMILALMLRYSVPGYYALKYCILISGHSIGLIVTAYLCSKIKITIVRRINIAIFITYLAAHLLMVDVGDFGAFYMLLGLIDQHIITRPCKYISFSLFALSSVLMLMNVMICLYKILKVNKQNY